MSSRFARACIACALAMSPGWTAAQPAELTLAAALDAALRNHPDLRASAYEVGAAQARIVQAGLAPNPELSLELENFAGIAVTRAIRDDVVRRKFSGQD